MADKSSRESVSLVQAVLEPAIQVQVTPDPTRYHPSHVKIETDLSDVPESERAGVIDNATELYWQLVSSEHEARSEGQEGGFPGHPEDA